MLRRHPIFSTLPFQYTTIGQADRIADQKHHDFISLHFKCIFALPLVHTRAARSSQ